MKNRVVTISREFGSGGRTIGRELAGRLGIPCYDEEVIEKLSERSGYSKEYIQERGEYAPAATWIGSALAGRDRNGYSVADNYHIALDSGVLGIEKCVDILADLYRNGRGT